MRIAFVHDWKPDLHQILTWNDGLVAMISELKRRGHEVRYFSVGDETNVYQGTQFQLSLFKCDAEAPERSSLMVEAVKLYNPDVILNWADCTRPNAEALQDLGKPMALCFAGGDTLGPTTGCFDHFFVESATYKSRFEAMGKSVSTAFGTNTKLFAPVHEQRKVIDTIFPATFCNWKRHHLFAESVKGLKAVACGFMYQDHETSCWRRTQDAGVITLPHVNADTLRHLFAASKTCLITSHTTGGSQRTVLEALAMNVPVITMSDNEKTSEYILDLGVPSYIVDPDPIKIRERIDQTLGVMMDFQSRPYILSKWSEFTYADAIESKLKDLIA